ncbi:MAG TPA: hypothetical protein VFZ17_09495, partial [Acidimicrobiia bacterium]|nr:hypothetical protein [Acidimicrobiia bacterium]
WQAQLDRGMRVELPDAVAQDAVDTARAQLLLAGQAWHSDPVVVAALEDWGFDEEALHAWARLGFVARRRAKRREPADTGGASGWTAWRAALGASAAAPGALLLALRRLLVTEHGEHSTLLPEWPAEWRGQPIDVREAPTRLGPVSFSVRWHGERAALLWDVPPGAVVQVPGLDAAWSTGEPRGETLLGPVP